MHKNFFLVLALVLTFTGCVWYKGDTGGLNQDKKANQTVTAEGKAQRTLDGYYVNGYLLTDDEIKKYDAKFLNNEFANDVVLVVGKIKEVEEECEPFSECREGISKVLYDVQSIKIVNK